MGGNDKFLKKYELPNESFSQLKWRNAPKDPVDEFPDHAIGVNCWDMNKQYLITGGKDGIIKLRNRSRISSSEETKAHAIFNGGVTAICFSQYREVIYSAGGDGHFLVWSVGSNPNPAQPIDFEGQVSNEDQGLDNQDDHDVKFIKTILEERFLQGEVPRKQEFKNMISKELNNIKAKLMDLLEQNMKADDEMAKLERDEFVIDI